MRRTLVVVALVLAFGGYAYAQFDYRVGQGGASTIWTPPGSDYSYVSHPDGSSSTIWHPPGSDYSYENRMPNPNQPYPSRRRYR